jgi:SAM-dependent methyltransferase
VIDVVRQSEEISAAVHAAHEFSDIEVLASDDDLARLQAEVRRVWSALGAKEPYWSVITQPRYKSRTTLEEDAEREFYESGRNDCDGLLRVLTRNGVDPKQLGTALELGCGVGRITIALARHFRNCVGVDISSTHLALAARKAASEGLANVSLSLLDDYLGGQTSFDLLYSLIALQHNPPPLMYRMLKAFLGRLNEGGVAVFQIPCVIWDYRFRIADFLKKRADEMTMHALPQRYVFRALAESGCVPLEVSLYGQIGPAGLSYLFVAQKVGKSGPLLGPLPQPRRRWPWQRR